MTRAAFDDCYGEGDERTESMNAAWRKWIATADW
jgi:hypothetical protein